MKELAKKMMEQEREEANICKSNGGGRHEPDMHSASFADGVDGVVDFCCKHCGRSGAAKIVPADIFW